jgi:hypothetical protein
MIEVNMKFRKAEKGQILYILALAMIALLGFTALAIDGANVYNDRRKDQSTADSAALAGAGAAAQYLKTAGTSGFDCSTINTSGSLSYLAARAARTTAISTATDDNVALANNDLSTNNGVATTCGTSNGVPYIDVHTEVTTTANTYFLKVITRKSTTTKVETIARVYVSSSYADGNVLVTLGTTCDPNAGRSSDGPGGIFTWGSGKIAVTGGGIYSASCVSAVESGEIFDYGGLIQYTGANGFTSSGMGMAENDIDPTTAPNIITSPTQMILWNGKNPAIDSSLWPVQAAQTLTPLDIPAMTAIAQPTACGSNMGTVSVSSGKIYPGTYSSLTFTGGGNLTFSPGTYCFTGPFSVSGGSASVTMDGCTLYFGASAGGLSNANSNIAVNISNSTVYITKGSYSPQQLNWTANNTKIYIGTGDFHPTNGVKNTYMDNSSIYLNNGSFTVDEGNYYANNITVYVKQGNFTVDNGAGIVVMNAPGCATSACGVGPAVPGLLALLDKNYSHILTIGNGTSNPHNLMGTVYAPTSFATLSGSVATSTLNVQLIAKEIAVSGSASLTMNVDNATLYSQGSMTIELLK